MWNEPYLETCCRSALHRLTRQLTRFEEKLDEVNRAATAAAISARSVPGRGIGFAIRAGEPEA